jgi:RHS repeat-associated protein
VGSKWYLRAVEDARGNYIEYDYDVEGEGIGGECLIGAWWPDASRWYHKATYLREVRWSGNRNGLPARMRVQFARENRPDWQVQYWDHRCVQARYAQQRLKTVLVQVHDSIDNQWYTLRQYQLNYSQSQLHSLLSSIQQHGKHGSQLLHTYSFGYQGGHNNVRLQTANNGQGGSTTYQYGLAWIHDCLNCGSIPWRTGIPLRRPVSRQYLYDGNGATTVDRQHAYADAKGQVTNQGFEYLGFSAHSQLLYTQSSVPELNRAEQRVETWYHQRTGNNIDPRRGRSYQQNIRAGVGDTLMGYSLTNWQSTVQNGTNWVRKATEEQHTHAGDGSPQNKSVDRTSYFYESTYGNMVYMEERNGPDPNQVLRITTTDYTNPNGHMRRPSLMRVFHPGDNGNNLCVSEKRMSYNGYGEVINTQQPISHCGDTNSANVISTSFLYDGYGNLVHEWVDGTTHYIVTQYEGFYALFPMRRYNANQPALEERVQFYGVSSGGLFNNDLSANDGRAFWGQVQQFCATDGFCTRQSYDSFGRPAHRWERLTAGQAWPGDAAAATRWLYFRYQSQDVNQKANIVVEWHAPRCQGNFVRKLYDGFGQLIQTQSPQHNWSVVVDGCGTANSTPQVVVDYAYDGLGRQVRASVPRGVNFFAWQHTPDWSQGHTQTWYDALGRTLRIDEPNQNTTWISYVGRATSTVRDGNGDKAIGNGDRVLRWQQLDDLGRLQFVRNYKSNGSGGWTLEGEIFNSYKAGTEFLEKVENRNTTADAYTTLTTMTYDFAGRKTSMWDANLGTWSYAYDKLGNLTRQTDARNYSTCLGYDTLNRLSSKTVRSWNNCSAGTVSANYTYSYDSQGRLSAINRTSGGSWSKSYTYNTLGLLGYEAVTIDSVTKGISHYYDTWNRPYAVSYPDGEVVKVNFNALGLPNLLCKSYLHSSGQYWCDASPRYADAASYDVAGRLTAVQYPAGGNLYRMQTYYGWTLAQNGGLLNELKVGTTNGSNDRFYRQYTYNRFGEVLNDGTAADNFAYDDLGRVTSAYGQSFSYWRSGRFNVFNGNGYNYNPSVDTDTYHGVKWVNIPGSGNTNQTVTIRAKGTQSSSVWPTMQLWVNGSLKASWQVNNTVWQSYSTSVAFTGREQIDVVFTNDGGSRDLFVENIKVGTVTLAANTAIYDRGAGNDAFNGDDVIAGQQGLYWNGALRFVYGSTATAMGYDLNGNMTYKLKQGEATVYSWNAENRLSAVTRNSSVLESYVYDMDGNRIKKSVTNGPVTRTFFPGHYEEEVTGGITTTIKSYSFNGQLIATRRGTTLSYLHVDHLSSNNLATSSSGTQTASRTYYAYGTEQPGGTGTLPTDRTFTGQKQDSTGLLYLNARYYDPSLGTFLSPDTLVPDAGVLFDYNRFAYARLNPLKYTDPSGHQASCTLNRDNSWDCNGNATIGIKTHQSNLPSLNSPTSPTVSPSPFSSSQMEQLIELAKQAGETQLVYDENGNVDWQATMASGAGELLGTCGQIVGGLCGLSFGGSGAVFAVGITGSVDLVADSNGDIAGYITLGGGGYAVFTGWSANGYGGALMAIHNASVDDLKAWSVQFGGSAYYGTAGMTVEWMTGRNSKGEPWHGAMFSGPMNAQAGWGAEVHSTATYSWQWFRNQLRAD